MALVRHRRLWLALLAEVLLLATLHQFDDWRYEEMPVRFVEAALFCGIAFYAAASEFAVLPSWALGPCAFLVLRARCARVACPPPPRGLPDHPNAPVRNYARATVGNHF